MTSCLQHEFKTIRLGYRQIVPEGRFIMKDKPATVVSAYYEMPSKYNLESYRTWIRLLLENVPFHLIFYTEQSLAPFIQDCRRAYEDRTIIIILPREEWIANQKYPQDVWNSLHAKDPEKNIHNPELYKVWFEKNQFVKRAIELNPFDHTDFLWMDAGICRYQSLLNLVKDFPVASRIPTDRIMLLNVMPFSQKDEIPSYAGGHTFIGGTVAKPRIAAGIIAGSIASWNNYMRLYDTTLEKYKAAGLFWGKEQDLMKTLVIENKSSISLIEVKPIAPESWFYSLIYLGCSDSLFRILRDEKRNSKRKTYDEMLSLKLPSL
jgi:hypothetical protein